MLIDHFAQSGIEFNSRFISRNELQILPSTLGIHSRACGWQTVEFTCFQNVLQRTSHVFAVGDSTKAGIDETLIHAAFSRTNAFIRTGRTPRTGRMRVG